MVEEEKAEKSLKNGTNKWGDFNHFHLKMKETKPARMQEYDPSSKRYLLKLLIDACIHVSADILDDDTRPQQGRMTKKQVAEKSVIGSENTYTALRFEEKLALKIESIFGL